MKNKNPDKRSDILTPIDRDESLGLMEPLVISESSPSRSELMDLALTLASRSSGLARSLPAAIKDSLRQTVRAMNCYYSNLIEGHNTHPIDIERALQGNYSKDTKKRELQLEAKSYIDVQTWIDHGGLHEKLFLPNSFLEIHKRFYENCPLALREISDPVSNKIIEVIPGRFREGDVQVGQHIPISAGAIPRFLNRYVDVFGRLGRMETLLASAAMHHRLLWIHPFLDGNGRVARLYSHALFHQTLETESLWSVARGLARNVDAYKMHLSACDQTRRNDLDGRGHLSLEALINFTHFYLSICIDQINFMENLIEPNRLHARVLLWAKEEIMLGKLPPKSFKILEALLYRGEIARGDISEILGLSDRHARRLVQPLFELGVLTSDEPKSALKLGFSASLANRWMPGLFPEA